MQNCFYNLPDFLAESKIKEINDHSIRNFDAGSVVEKILSMFDGKIVGLTGPLKELYEERVAIMEFDGGRSREQAESSAIKTIFRTIKNMKFEGRDRYENQKRGQ